MATCTQSCAMSFSKPASLLHPQLGQPRHSGVCSVCDSLAIEVNTVGRDRWPLKGRTFLRRDIEDLLVSSQAGCQFCWFLESTFGLSWLAKSQGRYGNGWLQLSADDCSRSLPQYSRPTITALLQLPQAKPALRRFLVHTSKHLDPNQHMSANDAVPLETAALARSWLSNCQFNHCACRPAEILGPLLPTRIIDVGTRRAPLLELRVTDEDERSCWAALSYCRSADTNPGFLTTSSTFSRLNQSRRRRLSLSSLPRTFREAVLMTRALNIRYLWIDMLCVIQDDEVDKLREAENAAHTFGNAAVTLVATASADIYGGLFHPQQAVLGSREGRVWEENAWCDTPTTLAASASSRSNASSTTLGVDEDTATQRGHISGLVTLTRSQGRDFKSEPIHRSPWTLGEYLLSRRRLMFTSSGVIWSCRQGVEAEFESDAIREEAWHDARSQNWTQIVEELSARRVHEPWDRLLSLAGLAKWMSQHRGCEYGGYAAGLWRDRLGTELLWYRVGGSVTKRGFSRRTDKSTQAPSWSWLSTIGAVEFSRRNIPGNEPHISSYGLRDTRRQQLVWKVLGCEVDLEVKGHEFWPATRGVVTISGPFAPVHLEFREGWQLAGRNASVAVTACDQEKGAFDLGMAVLDGVSVLPGQVFCLVATVDALEPLPSEGLLIIPKKDSTEREGMVFRRIGMFRSSPRKAERLRSSKFAPHKSWYNKVEEKTVVII